MRKFVMLFVLAVGICVGGSSARAAENYFSSHHLNIGQKMLDQGRPELAVEHLLRAVLFEPGNRPARQLLRNTAAKEVSFTSQRRHELFRFLEQVEYHDFLLTRLGYLQGNNKFLLEFVLRNGQWDPAVFREAEDVKSRMNGGQVGGNFFNKYGQMPEDKVLNLGQINEDLRKYNNSTLARLEESQESNRRLRKLNTILANQLKNQSPDKVKDSPVEQPAAIQPASGARSANSVEKGADPLLMVSELKDFREEFSRMQMRLAETDKKVEELTRNLAGMSLEVFEKNRQIADKEARVEAMGRDLQEARGRLDLVQRIIQQKDEQIRKLSDQITGMAPRQDNGQASSVGTSARVAALASQLQELEVRYNELQSQMTTKDLVLAQLTEKLTGRDQQINRLKEIVYSRDQDLGQMNGIVDIYKGKYREARGQVRDRDQRLSELEGALEGLKARLENLEKKAGTAPAPDPADSASMKSVSEKLPVSSSMINDAAPWSREDILERTRQGLEELNQYFSNTPAEQ